MGEKIIVSALPKTWILDLDGTIVKHNGYKDDGTDTFLDGAEEFLSGIAKEDMIVFLTSRTDREKDLSLPGTARRPRDIPDGQGEGADGGFSGRASYPV